uniref:Sortilin N-terminal domain-containing protein n=1 Tax=candidate division WOR-3 bacterium TaxID=2052148 RepID=A0A7C4CAN8_UNCW3
MLPGVKQPAAVSTDDFINAVGEHKPAVVRGESGFRERQKRAFREERGAEVHGLLNHSKQFPPKGVKSQADAVRLDVPPARVTMAPKARGATMTKLAMFVLLFSVAVTAEWVSIGPDGGNVQALAVDPQDGARLLAIAYEYPDTGRVYTSTDGGAVWSAVGRFADLYASKVVVDPFDAGFAYAMGQGDVIFRSSDSGASWTGYALPNQTFDFTCDPHSAGRLFAVGYWISGNYWPAVFISNDRGQSWTTRFPDSAATQRYATSVDCDPVNPGVLYVGTTDSIVYRSSNGGESWERRSTGLPVNAGITALSVNPVNSDIVLAGCGSGLFRTTDAGLSWVLVQELRRVYGVRFASGEKAYSLGYDSVMRVFGSADSGRTWQAALPGMQLGKGEVLHTVPDSPDELYLNGAMGVFRSTDRGGHWSSAHGGMRFAHISTISACPGHRNRLYLEVSENGVFKSTDGGATWTRCADFLACGNICGIGVVPRGPGDVLYALEGAG